MSSILYWNYIFVFRIKHINYLISLKNFCPCRDLSIGPPQYQANALPIELSRLGQLLKTAISCNVIIACYQYSCANVLSKSSKISILRNIKLKSIILTNFLKQHLLSISYYSPGLSFNKFSLQNFIIQTLNKKLFRI